MMTHQLLVELKSIRRREPDECVLHKESIILFITPNTQLQFRIESSLTFSDLNTSSRNIRT